ncbi:sugar phosphate isomerase/epimerase family protein [Pseudonocardia pini]|uniref:sugar phosphate isomerase/epimerase family protein n=1 Tax=Pseudonocardia pini TaxID=2758030 RepID=UPI0015F0FD52|nr:sugar phosphate isomerase/epimerase family protein [Pseudonocardia pini]
MSGELLVATCWTTAGDAAPLRGDERSPVPLRTRIEVAARAGFRGFGVTHADLRAALTEHSLADLRGILADNGMEHREVELLADWWTTGPAREASDRVRHELFEAAEALGARLVKIAPDVSGTAWERERWVAELAALGPAAEAHGTRVALEFLPWSNVADVHQGLALVEAAGHPAVGLLVDAWHVGRAGTPPADIAAVPLDRLFGVELNDFDDEPVGTLFEDTRDRRRYCGEGTFDLEGLVRALRRTGYAGPWGVEILSAEHRGSDLATAVAKAHDTAADLLRRA